MDAQFTDLAIDSLKLIELLTGLEDAFDVELSAELLHERPLHSVADLVQLISDCDS